MLPDMSFEAIGQLNVYASVNPHRYLTEEHEALKINYNKINSNFFALR